TPVTGPTPTPGVTPVYVEGAALSISLNPTSGLPGTSVTVTGSGFNGSATITIKFDTTTVATCSSNNGGQIQGTCTFSVPVGASAGPHPVSATDGTHTPTATF